MRKPTVCIGFDGVLSTCCECDDDYLGKPKDGAREFLQRLHKKYYVVILTPRRYSKIIRWLDHYDLWEYVDLVTSFQPISIGYVDCRSVRFDGNYDEVERQLEKLKPYYKRGMSTLQ